MQQIRHGSSISRTPEIARVRELIHEADQQITDLIKRQLLESRSRHQRLENSHT